MGIRFSSDEPPRRSILLDIEAHGNGSTNNESIAAHARPEDLVTVVAGKESESADSEKAMNTKEVLRPVVNLTRCAYHLL